MTTITLTAEQCRAIVQPYIEAHDKHSAQAAANSAKVYAALQRRTNARVERARQTAKSWKVRYSETRKALLAAQAEVHQLKRRLRNGEFE